MRTGSPPMVMCVCGRWMTMSSEATVQAAVRAEAARMGVYLWRNNSGVLPDKRGVPVRFGLGNDSKATNSVLKSSDLIGICPDGRFIAIEVKSPNWKRPTGAREKAQKAFIDLVKRNGGRGGFVTSIEDFRECMK